MDQEKINSALQFLNLCQAIRKKRGNDLTQKEVYSLLENFRIKKSDLLSNKSMEPIFLFPEWFNHFKKASNVDVFSWRNYWTCFENGNVRGQDYIKIYLSLDRDHLKEGVNQLISFLGKENIIHQSKSTSLIRTDNVIVRLRANDYDGLKKIYNFIKNNKYIREGQNLVNPFVPTVNNVGVMYDDGRSYNTDLSRAISSYINNFSKSDNISFSEFAKFIKNNFQNDPVFLNNFNQAFFEKGKYQYIVENDSLNKNHASETEKNHVEKMQMLENAIIATLKKYGKSQVLGAIKKAVYSGDYRSFTRLGYDSSGNIVELRRYLKENISADELKMDIMLSTGLDNSTALDYRIADYVNRVINKYSNNLNDLYFNGKKY